MCCSLSVEARNAASNAQAKAEVWRSEIEQQVEAVRRSKVEMEEARSRSAAAVAEKMKG